MWQDRQNFVLLELSNLEEDGQGEKDEEGHDFPAACGR
jgi:hypothetical protein